MITRIHFAAILIFATISTPSLLAAEPVKSRLAFLIGEDEYQTQDTLPAFAKEHLPNETFDCDFIVAADDRSVGFPKMRQIHEADLLFISVRRRSLPADQMAIVKQFIAAKKPVVGIRTASHAFALRDDSPPPPGHEVWPEFDRDVLGCHYTGHYGNESKDGDNTWAWPNAALSESPLLQNIDWPAENKRGFTSSLYRSKITAENVDVVLRGTPAKGTGQEPVAWTNCSHDRRVFYTSLGHPRDFQDRAFTALLRNGITWALEKDDK